MSFLINPFAFLAAGGDFESIATVSVGGGGASSIEFTSIPGTYQHLQVRGISAGIRSDGNPGWWTVNVEFNGDTGNGALHQLYGTGSAAAAYGATSTKPGFASTTGYSSVSTTMTASVVDILDYANTSKNTTVRSLTGADRNGAGNISIYSGLWISTSAVTSMKLLPDNCTGWHQHTTFALYGIKA